MFRFIIKRVLWMIPVMLGVIIVVYTINYFTPGDPVAALLGAGYTDEQYEAKQKELGLDQPFIVQFTTYIKNVVTKFDFGTSYYSKRPVRDELLQRLPVTLGLGLMSVFITILLSVPLGVLSAVNHGKPLDVIITSISVFLASIPDFWLALMGMIVFSFHLGWLPASGLESPKAYILPLCCLSLQYVAYVVRMTRSSMLEVVRQDYMRTARSKGLKERTITVCHGLRNALIPVITVVGLQLSGIMGGSLVVESIFSIPGVGGWMAEGVQLKNYPVVECGVMCVSLLVCVMNLLVDVAYAYADPRIKAQFVRTKAPKRQNNAAEKREENG